MSLSTVRLFLLTKPLPRAAIPALIGAIVGLLTNLLAAEIYKSGRIDWGSLPSKGTFWAVIVLVGIGIFYQKKVYSYDTRTLSVLEESKRGVAAGITEFYSEKIKLNEIDELLEADTKLRKIFESNP